MQQSDQTVRVLVDAHANADKGLVKVLRAPDGQRETARLVEVSKSLGYTGEAMPFGFGPKPDAGVPTPSQVILLGEQEWREVVEKSGPTCLPEDWGPVEDLQEVFSR